MPTPDQLKPRMLNPPPVAQIPEEHYDQKIIIYLTETKKNEYKQLKGDNTWSQIGRKAFKQYFDGEDGNVHKISPNIEAILYDAIAIMKGMKLPTQPRNIEDDAKWIQAKEDAKDRKKQQIDVYKPIKKELIDEIEFRQGQVNYGLEKAEIEPKKELSKEELKKKVTMNTNSYEEFMTLTKQLNQKQFEKCKWKQKEVAKA
jgi:hypothetical protein